VRRREDASYDADIMEIVTVGQLLNWSYANLAMAHAAVMDNAQRYGPKHFMIRSRLHTGLNKGTMAMGALADDERLKMVLPQACCYCGAQERLSVDHLIPTKRGGANIGENFVWACGACNSSKGAQDMLGWLAGRNEFPALLLLRRYLKLAVGICEARQVMEIPLHSVPALPFELERVPRRYPPPSQLRLWVVPLG